MFPPYKNVTVRLTSDGYLVLQNKNFEPNIAQTFFYALSRCNVCKWKHEKILDIDEVMEVSV